MTRPSVEALPPGSVCRVHIARADVASLARDGQDVARGRWAPRPGGVLRACPAGPRGDARRNGAHPERRGRNGLAARGAWGRPAWPRRDAPEGGRGRKTAVVHRPPGPRRLPDRACDPGFRDDASNRDVRIPRNRVRHEVLPALDAAVPGAVGGLQRLAVIAADEDALLSCAGRGAGARVGEGGVGRTRHLTVRSAGSAAGVATPDRGRGHRVDPVPAASPGGQPGPCRRGPRVGWARPERFAAVAAGADGRDPGKRAVGRLPGADRRLFACRRAGGAPNPRSRRLTGYGRRLGADGSGWPPPWTRPRRGGTACRAAGRWSIRRRGVEGVRAVSQAGDRLPAPWDAGTPKAPGRLRGCEGGPCDSVIGCRSSSIQRTGSCGSSGTELPPARAPRGHDRRVTLGFQAVRRIG